MSQIPEAVIKQLPQKMQAEGFDVEFKLKYSVSSETDKRTMTFVDNLWGIEVTGGADQFEPLTIIAVKRTGLARRAGIRVGDVIIKINETPADDLTMLEAQLEIHESGRYVKIFVKGEEDKESDDENFCEIWFKPLSQNDLGSLEWEKSRAKKRILNMQIYQGFPWNDRRRPPHKESNCYLVPSTVIQKREREIKLKATKEEYLRNLRELAAQKEELRRRQQEDDEEFEALARESGENSEEFGEIIKTTEATDTQ